jgi:hypothetical protein
VSRGHWPLAAAITIGGAVLYWTVLRTSLRAAECVTVTDESIEVRTMGRTHIRLQWADIDEVQLLAVRGLLIGTRVLRLAARDRAAREIVLHARFRGWDELVALVRSRTPHARHRSSRTPDR